MYKPTFGQATSASAFGSFPAATNANPFGQTSVFGKTQTTGFAPPAFGASTGTGLFGSSMPASNTLFGSSAPTSTFGQTQTTQPSFGFGTTSQANTNLFGAQPSTGTGLFGASTGSAFGQNKFVSTFGSTTNTGLFGAQPQNPTPAPLFGASTSGTATAFGAGTSAFGAGAQQTGTVIKFNPITSTDTLQKGTTSQQINVRHFCITCMKEYETKSLEELRFEDYAANRKGPQQSGLFGQTAPQPSLFGATAGTTGLFGSQPPENKSLFGATTSTLGGFGTGGVFGAPPAATTSLFGAKPAGFGTTTTSSTGFGFGAPATNNLFSNAQKPFGSTTTPSLFGQPAAQPTTGFGTTPGFSGFGAQTNQSIGLFGAQNKPATSFNLGTTTATTGFPFGQTSTTNTGLFAAKPATTGFGTTGFGSTIPTFGAPNTASSLFNKPATSTFSFGGGTGGFGGTSLNTGTSLFGNTQAKPGGLFGATGTGTGLFGSTTGFGTTGSTFGTGTTGLGGTTLGGSSMFGSSSLTAAAPSAAPAHSAILALASLPFADSPLFKNLLPAAGKSENQQKPTNAVTQKAILASKDMKVSPKADTRIKLKSLATTQTKQWLFEGLDETIAASPTRSTTGVKTLTLKPKGMNLSLTETLSDAVSNKENRRVSFSLPLETPRAAERDPESFYIRRNPLFKPSGTLRQATMEDIQLDTSSTVDQTPAKDVSPQKQVDISASESPRASQNTSKSPDSSRGSTKFDETQGFLDESSRVDEDWVPHCTGITLRRLDYYTIPSLNELESLVSEDGSCLVENFCVGRHGYGNLYFDETMDVSGLNIDSIVHFRHKEVIVYPDETTKPPVGEELNRKCQVTLEQVWPIDKATREPIRDVEHLQDLGYEEKLRRCTSKMRAHFMEYRPLTGSWVFRVDHFSKYGLSDSEDEEELSQPPGVLKPKAALPTKTPPIAVTPALGIKTNATTVLSPIPPLKQQCFSLADQHASGVTFTMTDTMKDKPISTQDVSLDVDLEEVDEQSAIEDSILDSPWSPSVARVDHHRVQLMKSSLFHSQVHDDDDEEMDDLTHFHDFGTHSLAKAIAANQSKTQNISLFQIPSMEDARATEIAPSHTFSPYAPPPLRVRPKSINIRHSCYLIPYEKSSIGEMGNRFIADMALMMGRCFRPGWASDSHMTTLTTRRQADRLGITVSSRAESDFSHTLIQRLAIYPTSSDQFKESIERHLLVQLEQSMYGDNGGCPMFSPISSVEALHRHCLLVTEQDNSHDKWMNYCSQVWQLCGALWGNMPALSQQDDPTSHQAMMMRKEALTEWLRSCANPLVEKETEGPAAVKAVLAYLSGNNVAKACETSQKKGEHYTALLLCSGQEGRLLLQKQLNEWTDVAADRFIEPERLKLYTVAAGLPILQTSADMLNACKGLDWRRVFALHYWYTCSPVNSIPEVLARYKEAFSGPQSYADKPHPPYSDNVTTSNGQVIFDLCYHLLELFCCRAYPLEPLLNPATHSSDPLDYRLSWLLEQVLGSLGYTHVSSLSSSIICTSFASQLEANGMWHWAVFVFLHLKDGFRRKQAVIDILNRHVVLLDDLEFSMEEVFVIEELKIPREWVYRAKSIRALSQFSYHDATEYLIQAEEWNLAHETIIAHLAPDLIINENVSLLEDLLKRIAPNASAVAEWPQQGQLLLDYVDIRRTMQYALDEHDAGQLEERLPQLASVCNRVVRWPTPTIKHRLCQAEIAKGTAHIYVNVKQLDCSASSMRDARALVNRLQLPEDYLLEELEIINKAIVSVE